MGHPEFVRPQLAHDQLMEKVLSVQHLQSTWLLLFCWCSTQLHSSQPCIVSGRLGPPKRHIAPDPLTGRAGQTVWRWCNRGTPPPRLWGTSGSFWIQDGFFPLPSFGFPSSPPRICRCGRPLDPCGHHRAACAEAGVLGRRGNAGKCRRSGGLGMFGLVYFLLMFYIFSFL